MKDQGLKVKDLLKTENIIKCSPQDRLKEALAKLSRTHDAAFVFDKNNKFLGVINPYYTIFKSNNPPETKVLHCLFNPPRLTLETNIYDLARLMVESKVYFLPVFENNNKFVGIATVNRVFQEILKNANLVKRAKLTTKKKVITVEKNKNLLFAYNLMRDKQVARLPVIDQNKRLVGIVARFDIRAALSEPKDKINWMSRVGEKKQFLDQPLEGYYKKIVVTQTKDAAAEKIIKKLLEKEVGSVVIVDSKYRPIGIVSSTDILRVITKLKPQRQKNIDLVMDENFTHKARLEGILAGFISKIRRFIPIQRFNFILGAVYGHAGKIKRYSVSCLLVLMNGKRIFAKVTGYDWKKAVREALDKIRRQLQ